jgi:cytochrome c553
VNDVNASVSARRLRLLVKVGLGLLLLSAVIAAFGAGRFMLRRTRVHGAAHPVIAFRDDEATRARGEHLARTLGGCAHCHGDDFGGRVMSDEPVFHLVAPNLTRGAGSAVLEHQPGDWARAIVHGVGRSGRSLVVMPSRELSALADADVAALVAFMQSVPPVDRDPGRTEVKPLGYVVFGLTGGKVLSAEGYEHPLRLRTAPEPRANRAYGEYLTAVCRGCHGPDLRGGIVVHPGGPPSADISPNAMLAWDFPAFEAALRTGVGRGGRPLDESMPWRATRGLTPEELRALWLGLRQD